MIVKSSQSSLLWMARITQISLSYSYSYSSTMGLTSSSTGCASDSWANLTKDQTMDHTKNRTKYNDQGWGRTPRPTNSPRVRQTSDPFSLSTMASLLRLYLGFTVPLGQSVTTAHVPEQVAFCRPMESPYVPTGQGYDLLDVDPGGQ
jgi:hypothetical protein